MSGSPPPKTSSVWEPYRLPPEELLYICGINENWSFDVDHQPTGQMMKTLRRLMHEFIATFDAILLRGRVPEQWMWANLCRAFTEFHCHLDTYEQMQEEAGVWVLRPLAPEAIDHHVAQHELHQRTLWHLQRQFDGLQHEPATSLTEVRYLKGWLEEFFANLTTYVWEVEEFVLPLYRKHCTEHETQWAGNNYAKVFKKAGFMVGFVLLGFDKRADVMEFLSAGPRVPRLVQIAYVVPMWQKLRKKVIDSLKEVQMGVKQEPKSTFMRGGQGLVSRVTAALSHGFAHHHAAGEARAAGEGSSRDRADDIAADGASDGYFGPALGWAASLASISLFAESTAPARTAVEPATSTIAQSSILRIETLCKEAASRGDTEDLTSHDSTSFSAIFDVPDRHGCDTAASRASAPTPYLTPSGSPHAAARAAPSPLGRAPADGHADDDRAARHPLPLEDARVLPPEDARALPCEDARACGTATTMRASTSGAGLPPMDASLYGACSADASVRGGSYASTRSSLCEEPPAVLAVPWPDHATAETATDKVRGKARGMSPVRWKGDPLGESSSANGDGALATHGEAPLWTVESFHSGKIGSGNGAHAVQRGSLPSWRGQTVDGESDGMPEGGALDTQGSYGLDGTPPIAACEGCGSNTCICVPPPVGSDGTERAIVDDDAALYYTPDVSMRHGELIPAEC